MLVGDMEVPHLIDEMLRQGRWPSSHKDAMKAAVAGQTVQALAPGEAEIWLDAPPFHTVQDDNLAWFDQFRRTEEIDFARAVIIGDFGPGTDSPIVLDYRHSPPTVMRLHIVSYPNPQAGEDPWPEGARFALDGHWVTLADSLDELVLRLGL